MNTQLFTIGFAQTSARDFFTALRNSGTKKLFDVRLNNTSQLAGFTKKDDLNFFLREVCDIEYIHLPEMAPTQEMLDVYKKHKGSWEVYEQEYNALIARRSIEKVVTPEMVNQGCLLCSEKKPHHCHRRLVAEYLQKHWGNVQTNHIV